eukprot:4732028-Pyramimonas_sp.AAC.1
MQDLTTTLKSPEGTQMAYGEWWGHIKPCKGLAQWKTKLTTIGAPASTISSISNFKDVGELIYSHILEDGTWHESTLQEIKLN